MKPPKYKSFSVFGTAVVLLIIAGLFLGGAWLVGSERGAGQANLTRRELPAPGIHSLVLAYPDGDVVISAGSGDSIVFSEFSSFGLPQGDQFTVNEEGGTASVMASPAKRFPFNLFNFANKRRLEVSLPKALLADLTSLQITTTSGHIDLPEGTFGKLKVESTSGRIGKGRITTTDAAISTISGEITELDLTADTMTLGSASGSISDSKLSGGKLALTSISGSFNDLMVDAADLTLNSTSGSIKAEVRSPVSRVTTTSGNIKLQLYQGITSGEYRSVSGNVDLTVPDDLVEIEYSTTSGSIEIKTKQVRDKGRIKVSTISGRIDINP